MRVDDPPRFWVSLLYGLLGTLFLWALITVSVIILGWFWTVLILVVLVIVLLLMICLR